MSHRSRRPRCEGRLEPQEDLQRERFRRRTLAATEALLQARRFGSAARIRSESESARFVEWLHGIRPARRCGLGSRFRRAGSSLSGS